MELQRCNWTQNDVAMNRYHDTEWGVAVHDDRKLFEFILIDTFQAGLSWKTILHKRENFREVFDDFDFEKIALYKEDKFSELMNNKEIIRNKLKIKSTISNAKHFIEIREKYGSFDKFIWKFVNGKTIKNKWKTMQEIPATSNESNAMSKELKKLGFKFVGSTICYAFMQAAGMVNNHLITCFRYNEV